VPGTFSYTLADDKTPAPGAVLSAGANQTLNVFFTPTDTTDYAATTALAEINVEPATLTVKANDVSRAYSTANPAFTDTINGFVNADNASVVSGTASLTTTATSFSAVGTYPITSGAGTLSAANYVFAFQRGTLTVTPAVPFITWTDPADITYGTALSATQLDATANVPGTFSYTLADDQTSAAGVVLNAGQNRTLNVAFTPTDTIDYTTTAAHVEINVNPATLTVKANDASRIYGTSNPAFTDTITGFVNGDNVSVINGAATLTTTADATSPVGSYPITAALGTLRAANYTFAFQNGTLTVAVNAQGTFGLVEDIYVIGSGTVSVSAANGVLANDSGPGQLTVAVGTVSGAEGGTFTFSADGSFTYIPPNNFPGFDYAKYTATDGQGDHGTATVNVLSQTGGVVWKFYESVLHRDPDYAGLQNWINDFSNGGKTGDIAVGFFESTELLRQIITGYYQQYLGRAADANGLSYYEDLWRKTGGPEQIKSGFAASPEFNALAQARYGAYPDGWLDALYSRILNRAPDQQGFDHWKQQLAAGVSESQVSLDFFTSPEAFDNDVTGWFYEYLGRAPTLAEQQQYANQMIGGANDRDIEQAITNLPEYGANPPASPPGTGVRLPDYFPQTTSKSQASIAATDAVFRGFGGQ
jgi:hypothetical protein